MKAEDDKLASYPEALRNAILAQRAELKARQLAGQLDVGPWAPVMEVKKKRRRRPKAAAKAAVAPPIRIAAWGTK